MARGCYVAGYADASFKGVAFQAVSADSEHGRRGAEGEFPFGEETAYADLGRRIRKYSIKARFVENSHIADANALIAACEGPGSGVLIHPTRGIVNAACTSCKVSDEVLEGQGVSYADLEFVEANDYPNGLIFGAAIVLAISPVVLSAKASFASTYQIAPVAYHRRTQTVAAASNIISAIRTEYAAATVNSATSKTTKALSDLALIAGDETTLEDAQTVSDAITYGIGAVVSALSPDARFQALRNIANAAALSSALPGEAGIAADAVYGLTRVTAGAYMAQVGSSALFKTSQDVFTYLDMTVAVLAGEEGIAYATCDNALFIDLRRFTVDFKRLMFARAYSLPAFIQYNFGKSVHPLVAAYDIFKDAKRHRELELANLVSSTGRFNTTIVGASA